MKTKRVKVIPYRRKRSGRTNYKKRLSLLVSGIPRLIIRKSNKNISIQIATYSENGDNVLVTATSVQLKKYGWDYATGNLPAAYLAGFLAGKKALSKKVDHAIVDLGLQTPKLGTRLYAAVKGAIDAGMTIPCSEDVFPSADRLTGKHIAEYGKVKKFKKDPADIESKFNAVKDNISKVKV